MPPRKKPEPQPERRWATYQEAAVYYRTSDRTVRRWVQNRKVVAYPDPNGTPLLDLNEIDAAMGQRAGTWCA